jgi:hypothetical protein
MLEHAVEDDQELAHVCGDRSLLGLASGTEALIESLDDRVASSGYERCHV